MNKLTGFCLAASLVVGVMPQQASANLTWEYNWEDAFAADGASQTVVGGSGDGFILPPDTSGDVNKLTFLAESVVLFDAGGSSTIVGSQFTDYVYGNITGLLDGNTNVEGATYGSGSAATGVEFLEGNHEITFSIEMRGTQTTLQNYTIDSIQEFNFYFDAGTITVNQDGVTYTALGYTQADYTDLDTLDDGIIVETASYVFGSGVQNIQGLPDGAIDLIVSLTDVLSTIDPAYGEFELFENDYAMVLGTTDGNNNLCSGGVAVAGADGGTQTCISSAAAILSQFGVSPDLLDTRAFFFTQNDGSFEKVSVIPEPSLLGLIGLGFVAFGLAASRRKMA